MTEEAVLSRRLNVTGKIFQQVEHYLILVKSHNKIATVFLRLFYLSFAPNKSSIALVG